MTKLKISQSLDNASRRNAMLFQKAFIPKISLPVGTNNTALIDGDIPQGIQIDVSERVSQNNQQKVIHGATSTSWTQTGNTNSWYITVPNNSTDDLIPSVVVLEDNGSNYITPTNPPVVTISNTTGDVTITNPGPKFASTVLTFTGNVSNNDTLTIGVGGTLYPVYTFKTTLIAGTTSAIMVKIGATAAETIANLVAAINHDTSVHGTSYNRHADLLFPDPILRAEATSATVCTLLAQTDLEGGIANRIAVVESMGNCTASTAYLTGATPDHASTVWTVTGAVAEDVTITINTDVYTVKDVPADPFEVLSGDETDFAANLAAAINGTDGINEPSEFVTAYVQTAATVLLNALVPGTAANAWVTEDDTANAAPTGATMADTGAAATDERYAGVIILQR